MAASSNGSVLSLIQKHSQKKKSSNYIRTESETQSNVNSKPNYLVQPKDASQPSKKTHFMFYGTSKNTKNCPNCVENGHIVYDQSSGDELCRHCGYVLESKVMSEEQEWRNFSPDNTGSKGADRNRVGETIDQWLSDGVAGTTMLGGSKRFQQLNDTATSLSSNDKLLKSAFQHIRYISEAFSMRDSITEIAKEIAKELQDMGQLKNRSNLISMLAVVYLACREANQTRTIKDLIIYDRTISEKELGNAINRIKKLIPQRGPAFSETASQILPRLCSRLNLSINIADVADHVTQRSTNFIKTSHRPSTLASGAIYMIVQLCSAPGVILPSAQKIAEVTGASEHTMKTVCKELLEIAEYLLPNDFKPTNEGGIEALRIKMGSKGSGRRKRALPYDEETE